MLAYDCLQLFESRIYPAQLTSLGIHPQAEGRDRAPPFIRGRIICFYFI